MGLCWAAGMVFMYVLYIDFFFMGPLRALDDESAFFFFFFSLKTRTPTMCLIPSQNPDDGNAEESLGYGGCLHISRHTYIQLVAHQLLPPLIFYFLILAHVECMYG